MHSEITLQTERLELRTPVAGDMKPMFAIVSDPATARFLGPQAGIEDHFTRFLRGAGSWWLYGYGFFTMRLRETGEMIGNCGIFHSWRGLGEDFDDSAEAGWIIAAPFHGHGYASEAMRAILDWFEASHGRPRIVCMISHGNSASLALAAKLGFAPLRDADLGDGDMVYLLERAATDS